MHTWFRKLRHAVGAKRPVPRPSCRLLLENLEPRCLPSIGFAQTNLVSDIPGLAAHTDPAVINPWAFTQSSKGNFLLSDNNSGTGAQFAPDGTSLGAPIVVPPPAGSPAGTTSAPTGQVINNTSGFMISKNGTSAPANILFATEDGTISGFNSAVDPFNAILTVDQSASNSVFKGLAIGNVGSATYLYATDFRLGAIDVFDKNFAPHTFFAGQFTDPNTPTGYAQFGINDINGIVYVTYAKQNAAKHDDVEGPGNGFIDEFSTNGTFLKRLVTGSSVGGTVSQINSPWGLAVAPHGFGEFSGALLVGNFGDSHVSAFELSSGVFLGQLQDTHGQPLVLNGGFQGPDTKGLWGIAFGNGQGGTDTHTLYFASGINDEKDGLFGAVSRSRGVSASAVANATPLSAALQGHQTDSGASMNNSASVPTGAAGNRAGFAETNLVSDIPGLAAHTDPAVINPWAFTQSSQGNFLLSDNNSGTGAQFAPDGTSLGAPIVVPPPGGSPAGTTAAPTGQVINNTSGFVISANGTSAPANILFATEDGTISGFNSAVDPFNAILTVDQSASNSVFKGLAIGNVGSATYLYATDFRLGAIDVFDKNFAPHTFFAGQFTDPNTPTGYAPFGINDINGIVYVTYAKQNAAKHDDVEGPGNGFIDEFSTNGTFLKRLVTGSSVGGTVSQINSPWGLAVAPRGFGELSGALLVGNFGDSHVSAFELSSGVFHGQLQDTHGQPLVLNGGFQGPDTKGLWGIAFGNGQGGTDTHTLYFASGINDEKDGLFGAVSRSR